MKILSGKVFNYFKLVVLIFLILTLIIKLYVGYGKESWGITEFLINYEAGFIRRGLLGQIILLLYNLLNISPYYIIITLCIICYFGLAFYFIKKFKEFKISNTLLLSAFLFIGPVVNNFWLRKDCFLLLLFIIIIKTLVSNNLNKLIKIAIINTLGIVIVLNHEGFLFWGLLPIFFIISAKDKVPNLTNFVADCLKNSLYAAPIILAFIACMIFNGTVEMRNIMWHSWDNIPFPFHQNNDSIGSFEAIGESFKSYALPRFIKLFTTSSYFGVAWAVISTVSLCYLLLNKAPERTKNFSNGKIFLSLLILQTPGIIILSIVGCDYGRWIFYWVSSSFIVYFVTPLSILINIASYTARIADCILSIGKKIYLNKINPVILYLSCGITLAEWYTIFYFPTTPIGTIIHPILYLLKLPNVMIWGI